ncbi:MAG: aldolase [Thermovibrio sp.]|nr:MAG: aldolase [Thermovibrio sp.]
MVPFKEERKELIKIGRIAFESGLTDTHGGNISRRLGKYILIKKSGKMLGFLNEEDFVLTTIDVNSRLDRFASIELKVHRSIYKGLPEVNSILHTHSPSTVACSLRFEKIVPMDSEGRLLLGEVPVLRAETVVSSDAVAEKLPKLLKTSPVAVIYSHGPFAVGRTPEEALMYISALENSCKILTYYYSLRS